MNNQKKSGTKKHGITDNMIWSFAERISAQLVSTLVGIILARMLSPDDYGVISMVMVFITICNVFVTRGLGTAIVQKREVNNSDYTTAFVLNFFIGIILYLILFMFAPQIEHMYGIDQLGDIIRVLGVRIPLASINTVQQAYIQRNMQFKKFFISTLLGTVISCIIGIVMAYSGCGVWALVFQYLINVTIDTLVLSLVSGWHPQRKISVKSINYIILFGGKILITDLICTFADNYRNFIVGKKFGSIELAYMEQGKKYPQLFVANVISSIQKVMLPGFSKQQDNLLSLKNMLRMSVNLGLSILLPMLIGFMALSPNFVELVLTEKWLPIVKFINVFAIGYLTRIFETISHQAILAIGRSDIALRIQIFINVIDIFMVSIVILFIKDVFVLACTNLITTALGVLSFSYVTKKYINYKVKEQLQDILPPLMLSSLMGGIVFLFGKVKGEKIVVILVQILVGIITYLFLAVLFKLNIYFFLKEKIIRRFLVKCKLK